MTERRYHDGGVIPTNTAAPVLFGQCETRVPKEQFERMQAVLRRLRFHGTVDIRTVA